MFEFINQYKIENNYYKRYKNTVVDWYKFLELINSCGYKIIEVSVEDSAGDIGLKVNGGTYSYESIMNDFSSKTDFCDYMSILIDNNIRIIVDDFRNDLFLITSDSNLDLNDMLYVKKKM